MKRKNLDKEFEINDNNGKVIFKCGYSNGITSTNYLTSFSISIIKFSKDKKERLFDERLGVNLTPKELEKLMIFLVKNK